MKIEEIKNQLAKSEGMAYTFFDVTTQLDQKCLMCGSNRWTLCFVTKQKIGFSCNTCANVIKAER